MLPLRRNTHARTHSRLRMWSAVRGYNGIAVVVSNSRVHDIPTTGSTDGTLPYGFRP
jgi:hypothetical protein